MKESVELDEKSGRWTRVEHRKFLEGLKTHGRNWKKISEIIKTRSSTQVRSHAQKHFIREATLSQGSLEICNQLAGCEFSIKSAQKFEASTQYGDGMLFQCLSI